jgi:diguanylate cyclase (GGDEF)-like protein
MERANRIMGMVFDAAGDLWFGSRGDGLFEWTGYADWEGWGDKQGLPSPSIWSIAPFSADRVFVGTEHGPAWIDPLTGSAGPLSSRQPWAFGQVRGMGVDRDGSLWAATHSGAVLRIDPKTGRTEQTAKLPELIIQAFEDSSGRLFLGTRQGLYLREPRVSGNRSLSPRGERGALNSAPHRIPAVDALTGNSAPAMADCESPDGADWFVVGSRLLRFKDGLWSVPAIEGMPKQSGELSALSCAKDGALWLIGASGDGDIWRLTPSGERLQAWRLELPPVLRTLDLWAILADRRGWVWVGTDLGLAVWNGRNWRHLTQESGLIWNDINQGVMREGADGSLWIGTSGGVGHLLHPERVFKPIPLTVSVTEIQRGETSYLGARQITLPWGGLPLHFHVASSAMRNRSELTLKVRMDGLQSEWMESPAGNATFPQLPPGKYTFEAMACNPSLNICSLPVKIDVRALPPWWRTNWFYILCGLVFVLLVVAVDRLRAQSLRARSRHLEELVAARTRELEASRTQLRIQATHDGLTGMLNRTAILRALSTEMDRAQRENHSVVIMLIDLDNFKRINDSYGHLAGDEALRWFAAAVGTAIRAYDHAGRYGGEEFLLVLTELPHEAVEQRLISLHASISNLQVCVHADRFPLNCSAGATVFDPSNELTSVESLLAISDQALYEAKAEGRNCVVFRPPGYAGGQQESHTPLSNSC